MSEDPYAVLGISQEADDDEVRAAFHRAVEEGKDFDRARSAYEKVRTQKNRAMYYYLTVPSFLAKMPGEDTALSEEDRTEVVKELAFLSDWELNQ